MCLILNFRLKAVETEERISRLCVQIDQKSANIVQLTILVLPFFSIQTCCLKEAASFLFILPCVKHSFICVCINVCAYVNVKFRSAFYSTCLIGLWHNLLSHLTKLAHEGGWLRPAGVIETMRAICTDGHFDTKKGQETKTQSDQTPQCIPTGRLHF